MLGRMAGVRPDVSGCRAHFRNRQFSGLHASQKYASGRTRRLLVAGAGADEDNANKEGADAGPPPLDGEDKRASDLDASSFTLDDINPVSLGRRSRQAFDDVWSQFTRLSSPTTSGLEGLAPDFRMSEEFVTPQAEFTKVLVVGATGRVGRILVRKLLLRGYSVRALVRNKGQVDGISSKVELFEGDVCDYKSCKAAVQGVDKVVHCAAGRSTFTAEMVKVEEEGVSVLARAFMDSKAKLASGAGGNGSVPSLQAKKKIIDFSSLSKGGLAEAGWKAAVGRDMTDPLARVTSGRDLASVELDEKYNYLWFRGAVYTRFGCATLTGEMEEGMLDGCETLLMRVRGDGRRYTCILETSDGSQFSCRFSTKLGFQTLRLPFNGFRAQDSSSAAVLDPARVTGMRLLVERPSGAAAAAPARSSGAMDPEAASRDHSFSLVIHFIKAQRSGTEPDFILLSCAGVVGTEEMPKPQLDRRVAVKRRGEALLKNTGLGYTIVRPGPLLDEPAGYKALVFDQGNRITQGIGYADVANVCLRALHDSEAFNKTFDVSFEFTSVEADQEYELVGHLADRSNNFLTPALRPLQRNT